MTIEIQTRDDGTIIAMIKSETMIRRFTCKVNTKKTFQRSGIKYNLLKHITDSVQLNVPDEFYCEIVIDSGKFVNMMTLKIKDEQGSFLKLKETYSYDDNEDNETNHIKLLRGEMRLLNEINEHLANRLFCG
jgi:hypothetical protein